MKGAPSVQMFARADGGYAARSSADTPLAAEAIKPATVAGGHLLLARLHGGVGAIAEKISSAYRIPQAWRARTGAYRATDGLPGSYPGVVPRTNRLAIDHGVLVWKLPDSTQVLAPEAARRAFTFGFSAFSVRAGCRRRPHPRRQHTHPPSHHL